MTTPLIVHLEDPPGSGRNACDGGRLDNPGPDEEPTRPRQLCTGCHVRAISTRQADAIRGAFADAVAGALIDAAPHPPRDNIERRTRVCDLLEIASDVYEERGDTATAETIRQHAYAIAPPYVADRIRRKAAESSANPSMCGVTTPSGANSCVKVEGHAGPHETLTGLTWHEVPR